MSIAMPYGAEVGEGHGAEGMRLVRPRALLLTAAAPELNGDPSRQRAWRLLEVARRTHDVHLIVRVDARLRYDHWLELGRLTRQLTLVPRGLPWSGPRATAAVVDDWARRFDFDALLCGAPGLWPAVSRVSARVRFCDGRHDAALLERVLAPVIERAPIPLATPLRRAA